MEESSSQADGANDFFYRAFNGQNLEMMSELWHDDPESICVHPGWPVLYGYPAIIQSWKDIFVHARDMEVKPSDVRIVAGPDFAWVSCKETIFSIHSTGVQSSDVHATNLFRRVGGKWKMTLHHASALPPRGGAFRERED